MKIVPCQRARCRFAARSAELVEPGKNGRRQASLLPSTKRRAHNLLLVFLARRRQRLLIFADSEYDTAAAHVFESELTRAMRVMARRRLAAYSFQQHCSS